MTMTRYTKNKIHVYNYEGILQQLSVYTIEEGFH